MGVGSERSHARKSERLGKLGFSKISRILERIIMEYIEQIWSLDSIIQIESIYFIRFLAENRVKYFQLYSDISVLYSVFSTRKLLTKSSSLLFISILRLRFIESSDLISRQ